MTIGNGWLFAGGVIVALAVLAPDSEIGGTIRDVFSQLRGASSSFMGTAGEGSRDIGGFLEE